ncbi:MAG TPA: hypothetical protein PLL69_01170 [Gemmatimonadales bacterium]|nr:hypothetical protein [Gemmatimonadales bacterium]
MSPALWYADDAIFRWLRRQPGPVGSIYLDVGLLEGDDTVFDVRRMRDLLLDRGWMIGTTLDYVEDPEGDHDEASWGLRVEERWDSLTPSPDAPRSAAATPPRRR